MKIVIVSMSGIGNLVMTTPCARALSSMGHEVVICTWPRAFKILDEWDGADVVIDNPIVHAYDADHVIVSKCGAMWDDEWTRGKVWRAGPDKNPWTRHESEYYMDVARSLGYEGESPAHEISLPRDNQVFMQIAMDRNGLVPGEYVCIAACYLKKEHWGLKHWGNDKFAELATKLDLKDQRVVFVGGNDDYEDANQIIVNSADTAGRMFNACGCSPDIRDTAVLLKHAKVVVGNDGGLMHVAAAVGTPTVTVFTFTNPVKNRPVNTRGAEVMVPCADRPMCQHGRYDGCRDRGCFDVSIDEVLGEVCEFI